MAFCIQVGGRRSGWYGGWAVAAASVLGWGGFGLGATAEGAVVSVSGTAPTVDGADVANLTGTTDPGGDSGHVWSDRPRHGQTFTTGAAVDGYLLTSASLYNLSSANGGSTTWTLRVGTVDGSNNFTEITSENAVGTGVSMVANTYVTLTLAAPVLLAPNTLYGFDFFPSTSGFVSGNAANDTPYAGGSAYSVGDNLPTNPLTMRTFDRRFHIDLAAVPEPSTWALLGLAACAAWVGNRRRATLVSG